jgi:enoyl-CoA hydratase
MIENYRAFVMLEQLEIPVISAIRGVCLGSAFELALFSHFRLCANDAVLGLPESTYNLMPGIGGIQKVAALAGKARAIEIILRGVTFSASEAKEMGLVDGTFPKNDVIPVSIAFANALPVNFKSAERSVYLHKFLKPLHAKD